MEKKVEKSSGIEIWRAKTLSEYYELAQAHIEDKRFFSEKTPSPAKICNYAYQALEQAVFLVRQFRLPESELSWIQRNDFDDHERASEIKQPCVFAFCYLWGCIAGLSEFDWENGAEYENWPRRPSVEGFDTFGWSALTVIDKFTFSLAHTIYSPLKSVCGIEDSTVGIETPDLFFFWDFLDHQNVVLEPALDPKALQWLRKAKRDLEKNLPTSRWPDEIIEHELRRLRCELNFEENEAWKAANQKANCRKDEPQGDNEQSVFGSNGKLKRKADEEKGKAFEPFLRDIATQVDNIIVSENAKGLFQKHIDNVFREAEKYRKYLHAEYVKASKKMMKELYDSKPRDCYDWFSKAKENTLECFMDHVDLDFSSEVHSWMEKQPKLDPLGYVYDMARGGTTYKQHDNLTLLDYQYFILACIHDCQRYAAGQTPIYFNPKVFNLRLHEPCDLKNGSCGKTYTLIAGLSYRDFTHKVQPTIQIALQAVEADCIKSAGTGPETKPAKELENEKPLTDNVFKKSGDFWIVKFGGETKHIEDSAGMPYIKFLLSRKGEAFSTGKFLSDYNEKPVALAGGDKVLDREATNKQVERMKDIARELDDAESNNDIAAQDRLEEEKAKIESELLEAVGFAGRGKELNPEFVKYRLSIGNAIARAIKKIDKHLPQLAEHLNDSISTPYSSASLSYRPKTPIEWTR